MKLPALYPKDPKALVRMLLVAGIIATFSAGVGVAHAKSLGVKLACALLVVVQPMIIAAHIDVFERSVRRATEARHREARSHIRLSAAIEIADGLKALRDGTVTSYTFEPGDGVTSKLEWARNTVSWSETKLVRHEIPGLPPIDKKPPPASN